MFAFIAVMRIINGGRIPCAAYFKFRIDLDPLYHNKKIRINVKYRLSACLSSVFPVIRSGRIVPYSHSLTVILSVRLVFQVDRYDRIIVLIVIGKPCKRLYPVLGGEIAVIPQRYLMTARCGSCAVNIYHDLNAVFSAPFNSLVPYIKAVHRRTALNALDSKLGVFVLIYFYHGIGFVVFPLKQYLGRHRHTKQIKAMIGYFVEHFVHILRPYAIENLTSHIVAKPVAARKPHRVAVHINDLSILIYVKPVVMILVGRSFGNFGRELDRQSRAEHYSRSYNCRRLFNK